MPTCRPSAISLKSTTQRTMLADVRKVSSLNSMPSPTCACSSSSDLRDVSSFELKDEDIVRDEPC